MGDSGKLAPQMRGYLITCATTGKGEEIGARDAIDIIQEVSCEEKTKEVVLPSPKFRWRYVHGLTIPDHRHCPICCQPLFKSLLLRHHLWRRQQRRGQKISTRRVAKQVTLQRIPKRAQVQAQAQAQVQGQSEDAFASAAL